MTLKDVVSKASGIPVDQLRPEDELCKVILGPTARLCPKCGACYLGDHKDSCSGATEPQPCE